MNIIMVFIIIIITMMFIGTLASELYQTNSSLCRASVSFLFSQSFVINNDIINNNNNNI